MYPSILFIRGSKTLSVRKDPLTLQTDPDDETNLKKMVSFHGVRIYPIKKILQSTVLLLLLLAISSNLLASSYSRTAGGSWADWGWSADWIPPFSFPIGQAITLGLSAGVIMELKAAYMAGRYGGRLMQPSLRNVLKFIWNRPVVRWGGLLQEAYWGYQHVIDHLVKAGLLGVGVGAFEFLDNVLGFSTPNLFQFLPDSRRSGVDNFQLGWSKTAGPWLYYFT
jgi:hypothetical protein